MAEIKNYSTINMNQKEIKQVVVDKVATDPITPKQGQMWFNTTEKELKAFDGTVVKTLMKVKVEDVIGFDDAVKAYSLDQFLPPVQTVDMNGQRLMDVGDPVLAGDGVNRRYVDAVVQGLQVKRAVRAATTENIALTGAQTIDGVADLVTDDRVLVKNQTNPIENGIYSYNSAGIWYRDSDADGSEPDSEIRTGTYVFVGEGTTQKSTGWNVITTGAITIDTTPIEWAQFSGAGSIQAGAAVTLTGNVVSVNVDDTTLEIFSNMIRIKDGGVTTEKIADGAITKEKLAADAIETASIKNGSVTADKLGDVTGDGLQRNATTNKIEVDNSVLRVTAIDTDPLLGGATPSDEKVASQKAAKTYIDEAVAGAVGGAVTDSEMSIVIGGDVDGDGFTTVINNPGTDEEERVYTIPHTFNSRKVMAQVLTTDTYEAVNIHNARPTDTSLVISSSVVVPAGGLIVLMRKIK